MKTMRNTMKGFTLVELLMVVIIIGILATLAIPNYVRSVERSKGSKAIAGMDSIRKANLQYRAFFDTFSSDVLDLEDFDLPDVLVQDADPDWSYAMVGTDNTLDITASRLLGPYSGSTMTMTHDGTLTADETVWGVRP